MVFNAFAAGKKVYGQGSYAPTRGQVSAQGARGYLQREIRKPQSPYAGVSRVGPDGQSDTRSGVAASMLANKRPTNPPGKPGKVTGPSGPIKLPTGYDPDVKTGQTPDGQNGPYPNGGPVGAPQPPNTAPGGGGIPTVEIGPDGTLQLPYDSQWSASVMSGLQDMNSQLMGLQFDQQEQAMQYGRMNRDADIDYGDVKRGTLGANASGGTAYSSQYGNSVSENARAYGNYKNDLLMDNNAFNQRTAYDRLSIQNAFNEMLRQDVIDRAERAIAEGKGAPGREGQMGTSNGGGGGNGGPRQPIPRDPKDPKNGNGLPPKGPKGPKKPPKHKDKDKYHPRDPGPKKPPKKAQANAKAYLNRKAS